MRRTLTALGVALAAHSLFPASSQAQCAQDSILRDAPLAGDRFGAALDVDGALAVIGAPGAAFGVGRLSVVERSTELRWSQGVELQVFQAGETALGTTVAIQDDVIMAAVDTDPSDPIPTYVLIYVFDGSAWVNRQTLDGGAPVSGFGTAIAIEGDRAYVGAPTDAQVGKVYVYDRNRMGTPTPTDDIWVEAQVLTPPNPIIDMEFGASLAAEGNDLAVGCPRDLKLSGPVGIPVGSVFMYQDQGGGHVLQPPKLRGSTSSNEGFGSSVALSGDRLLVGAPGAQSGQLTVPGAGFAFDRDALGVWTLNQKLLPNPTLNFTAVGYDVDLVGDLAILGAPNTTEFIPSPGSTHAYLNTDGVWDLIRTHVSDSAQNADRFGTAVALTGGVVTGDLSLVGAPNLGAAGGSPGFGLVEYRGTTLEGCPPSFAAAAGGTHALSIAAGVQNAGEAYWVFGSATGTSPGLVLDGHNLPLVFDAYFQLTLNKPFAGPFTNLLGVLDAQGNATASVSLAPDPGLQGVRLFHAFTLADVLGVPPVTFASHAVSLLIN